MSAALIDISQVLHAGVPVWPGEPSFAYERLAQIDAACPVNTGRLTLSTHAGTHADAPRHYAAAGLDSADTALDAYVGRCVVLDMRHARSVIEQGDLDWPLVAGEQRVLLRTYAQFPHAAWDSAFTAVSAAVIARLGQAGVHLVGTDAPSLDPQDSKTMDAHQAILRHDMRILEGLVLDHVEPGPYELIALPLRIAGSDSSPVRAVLRALA